LQFYVSDDQVLLYFLRTKKYSVDDATKVFENHLIFRLTRPLWFEINEQRLNKIREVSKTGCFYFLRKRCSDGSLVYFHSGERFDVDKYSSDDAFNLSFSAFGACMYEDENQILGYTIILNYINCSLKFFTSWSMKDIVDFASSANKSAGRFKKIIIVGLPSAANALFAAAKTVLNEKLLKRIVLVKDYEELTQHVDKGILTDYVGGQEPENEVIDEFIKKIEDNYSKIKEIGDFEIDIKKAAACRHLDESLGSFRTLEID
jgi:CRAL/TRIO domain